MAVALLDSSTVVGFLDADDAHHPAADKAVRAVAADCMLVVSVVTYAELLTGARLGHHDERIVREFFDRVIAVRIAIDTSIAESAAEIRATAPLKLPDALILATACRDADLVVTGDARWSSLPDLACDVQYIG